jgi:hypothetical protein
MKQSWFRMSEVKWFDNGKRRRRGHGRLDALYGGWGQSTGNTRGEKLLYANLTLKGSLLCWKADHIDNDTSVR